MSESRTNGGRPRSRAFRPLLDGRLEDRVLMSSTASEVKDQLQFRAALLKHPAARNAYSLKHPPHLAKQHPSFNGKVRRRTGVAATQTLKGGEDVRVNAGGTHYHVAACRTPPTRWRPTSRKEPTDKTAPPRPRPSTALVSQAGANYPQPIGTVRAYADVGRPRRHHRRRLDPEYRADDQSARATATERLRQELRLRCGGPGPPPQYRPDHRQQRPDRGHRGFPGRRPLRPARRQRHDIHRPDRLRRDLARCVDHDRRRRATRSTSQRNHACREQASISAAT